MNTRVVRSIDALRCALLITACGAFATVARAQDGLGRCAEPALGSIGKGDAGLVHPEALRAKFAERIVAKDWLAVIDGYGEAIDVGLRGRARGSAEANALRDSLTLAVDRLLLEARNAVQRPKRTWAAALNPLDINQTRPTFSGGRLVMLETASRPRGVAVPTAAEDSTEVDALCWTAWSVYQLLHAINFETVPDAVLRVEATAARWDRYEARGPLQLPHELALNRVVRALNLTGGGRYDPPTFELIFGHPFAGFELRRADGAVLQQATAAAHVGGFTLWLADRKFPLSVTWVASAAQDVVGQGPVVRLGELGSVGYIDRKPPGAPSFRSFALQLDALAFLLDDERAKKVLSLVGLSAATLEGAARK